MTNMTNSDAFHIDTSRPLLLNAYAKINLTLDVFSKRADGYHDIASVMQTINLSDTLQFTRTDTPGITFTCDAPEALDVPTDATNLVVRAAQAVLDAANAAGKTLTGGVAIHLIKRIPSQAGLGGGSSDAATALRGVNTVLNLKLDGAQLKTLAAQLGSDVPFFLVGGTAVARGRGEKITPLPDTRGFSLVIVKPDESVSTGWAYNELDAIPDRQSHRATKRMEEALRNDDQDRVIAFQSNDFELPIFQHHPKLAWLHDELMMSGCVAAHLCGSGSALYGIRPNIGLEGVRIAGRLKKRYPHTVTAHTLERFQSFEYDSFDDYKPDPAP
jgi:4-diphosphocytidyl-2-C-methyl-D-erythritol kinase